MSQCSIIHVWWKSILYCHLISVWPVLFSTQCDIHFIMWSTLNVICMLSVYSKTRVSSHMWHSLSSRSVMNIISCLSLQTLLMQLLHPTSGRSCTQVMWVHLKGCQSCSSYLIWHVMKLESSNQVWDIGHMQHITILAWCMLNWVYILHTRYVTCFCAVMLWYLEHKNRQLNILLGHFTNFSCICETLTLYSARFTYTNMFYYWLSC